jgi:hypothetical protein
MEVVPPTGYLSLRDARDLLMQRMHSIDVRLRRSTLPSTLGLSQSDLKELTRDPLCVEERGFRGWVRKQERRKSWPRHQDEDHARRSRGRPSDFMGRVVEIIAELHSDGKITASMRNKEMQTLVQKFFPSGCGPSLETVRLARKEVEIGHR